MLVWASLLIPPEWEENASEVTVTIQACTISRVCSTNWQNPDRSRRALPLHLCDVNEGLRLSSEGCIDNGGHEEADQEGDGQDSKLEALRGASG